ncbi:MAG: ATP-dependent DNA helicase UvrD2 [Acidimicrobiales bacterium]|nr:ATP-dependent DNA helicase UvrD2 [Acidimicrobiales bacterium]
MVERLADADVLLEDLTDEQRDAVTTKTSPLAIIAGAGSGKTRVLTRRIAWQAATGAIDPRKVLAVTFTRRAAGELRRRTRALGLRDDVAAGTFHSIALAVLRNRWADSGRKPPELLDRRMAFLAKHNPKLDRATIADIDAEIGWSRARLITPEAYTDAAGAGGRRPGRGHAFVARVYADYDEAKRKRRLVDFDDLLALCHATMTQDEKFAAAQRWRHRHLLVDEFQDVNPLQFALLQSWLGPDSTLVIVGDPNQAIYGWNGAEPDLLDNIDDHLPGTAVLRLRTNFRSTPEILGAAARVLDIEPQPAIRPPGDEPTVRELDGDTEAIGIARSVRGAHKPGAPWRHQAILARTNAQLPALRAALERAGIPTRSRGDGALLRRPEIMELLDRWDDGMRLSDVLSEASTDPPDRAEGLSDERRMMLRAFLDVARGHLELERRATVEDFVASLRNDDRIDGVHDGVELATFHAAKGLEWPIVHLVGIEDGYVPIAHAHGVAARSEERRLLYVAATRAERELHVSWARTREIGGSTVERSPSRWIEAFRGTPEPLPDERPSIANLRAKIAAVPETDLTVNDRTERDLVRDQLLLWRKDTADRAKVAPTAVLSDRTVERLSIERPCRMDELAAIEGIGQSRARRFGLKLLEITCLDE